MPLLLLLLLLSRQGCRSPIREDVQADRDTSLPMAHLLDSVEIGVLDTQLRQFLFNLHGPVVSQFIQPLELPGILTSSRRPREALERQGSVEERPDGLDIAEGRINRAGVLED